MRYKLSDYEWTAIKPMLPNKPRGVQRVNDRRVLNGIFWVLRSGVPHREIPVTFLVASAESIPLDDRTVDTVVTTWSLCTIPQAATALREVRRVLRPGGGLLFVEHGLAADDRVR
jgi:transposase